MTSFVTLWDEKYGVPESRSDARDFIEALEEQPEEANDNFDTFARLLADFAARANDICVDPYDLLEEFSTFELSGQLPRAIEVEFPFDSIELIVFFHKAILTAAKHSRLVVYHDEAGWVLPDDDVDEILSAGWEDELRRAFAPPSADDSPLPNSTDEIGEILARMLRQHVAAAGLKAIKIFDHNTGATLYTNSKALDSELYLNIGLGERQGRIGCFPNLGVGDLGWISYIKFYELPYGMEPEPLPVDEREIPEELVVRTVADLQRMVDKTFEMFMYFYPHCRRRGDLYRLIVDNLSSPRFSRRFVLNAKCEYRPDYFLPDKLCRLAQESRQPDYPALEAMYRESYIEHKQWERRETCLRQPNSQICVPDYDDDYSRERLTDKFDYYQMAVRVEIEPHTKQTLIDFLHEREARAIREGKEYITDLFSAMLENSDLDEGPYVLGYELPTELSEIKQQYKLIPKGATLLYFWAYADGEHSDFLKEIREYVAKKGGIILFGWH